MLAKWAQVKLISCIFHCKLYQANKSGECFFLTELLAQLKVPHLRNPSLGIWDTYSVCHNLCNFWSYHQFSEHLFLEICHLIVRILKVWEGKETLPLQSTPKLEQIFYTSMNFLFASNCYLLDYDEAFSQNNHVIKDAPWIKVPNFPLHLHFHNIEHCLLASEHLLFKQILLHHI